METPFELHHDDNVTVTGAAHLNAEEEEHGIAAVPNCVEEDGNKCRISEEGNSLVCPICMDVWTNSGEHHICCLPCGHIYGMSCIKKWLQHRRDSKKCPLCKMKCSLEDVRKLYASLVVAVDEESQKRIRFLEDKCTALESKDNDWHNKEAEWKKREAALHVQIQKITQDITEGKSLGQVYDAADSGISSLNIDEINERLARAKHMTVEQRIGNMEQLMEVMLPVTASLERKFRLLGPWIAALERRFFG